MASFTFEGQTVESKEDESVLDALLRQGIAVQNGCKAGACQACLLSSDGPIPPLAQSGLDDALVELRAFLSCQSKAMDIESARRLDESAVPWFESTLTCLEWASEDVLVVDLEVPGLEAAPGRFVRLRHSDSVVRPYSIATPAGSPSQLVRLHIRVIPGGLMSGALVSSRPGDRFEVQGPFGKCQYRSTTGQEPILMIGSGTGLAPLFAIATDALGRGHTGPVTLYHGATTSARLYYRDELRALDQSHANFNYVPCADHPDSDSDRLGSPLHAALEDRPDLEGTKVYLCGHPELVKGAKKQCFLAGANLKDIAADAFEPA